MSRQVSLAILILLAENPAQRRELDSPPVVEFSVRNHMTEAYRESMDQLCNDSNRSNSGPIRDACTLMAATLNQERLLSGLRVAENALEVKAQRYRERDHDLTPQKDLEALRSIIETIEKGHYVVSVPVEFETNMQERVYELKWREWSGDYWRGSWSGPEVKRRVKFMPRMHLTVTAFFEEQDERGRYGYWVCNSPQSEASVGMLYIECVGLTKERLNAVERTPWMNKHPDGKLFLAYPSGYRQDFKLGMFREDNLILADAGATLKIEHALSVPWAQLPGVVRIWVPVWEFPYPLGMDAEMDPEDLTRLFAQGDFISTPETGPKTVPRHMYVGKTIGPMPLPERDQRTEFAVRIHEYLEEARQWGWCPDAELADELENQLSRLREDLADKPLITSILSNFEAAYESEKLLEEAYILLKYNLEYLAQDDHWTVPQN